jgi:hypothetical protein
MKKKRLSTDSALEKILEGIKELLLVRKQTAKELTAAGQEFRSNMKKLKKLKVRLPKDKNRQARNPLV